MHEMKLEEIRQMVENGYAARAASAVMDAYDDKPMADIMRRMSAQMDFYEDTEKDGAISRTCLEMDAMIRERQDRHAGAYVNRLTDDMVRELSSGEVTEGSYSYGHSRYHEHGLFDPAIFGGCGTIPVFSEQSGSFSIRGFGTGMGHVLLPCHVTCKKDHNIIASLLGIRSSQVDKIASGMVYVNMQDKTLLPQKEYLGSVHEKEKDNTFLTGGDALYRMLCDLGYGDKPQRLAFCVLPVVSPVTRPMAYKESEGRYIVSELNDLYEHIILRSARIRRLQSLGAPEIILVNERRMLSDHVNGIMDYAEKTRSSLSGRFSKKRTGNGMHAWYQLSALCRENHLFPYRLPEVPATEIKSLHVFPEEITISFENGDAQPVSLEHVIDTNSDVVHVFDETHTMEIPEGVDPDHLPKDLQEESDAIDRERDRLTAITDEIWDGAKAQREAFTVFFDKGLGMFRKA